MLRRVHVYVWMVVIEYVCGAQRGLRRLLGLPITRTVANFLVDVDRPTTGKRNGGAISWQETFATLKDNTRGKRKFLKDNRKFRGESFGNVTSRNAVGHKVKQTK